LAEQVKNNGYGDDAENSMKLAQAMLAGRSLEAFLNEKRSQEAKNRVRKTNTLTEHTPSRFMTSPFLSCQFKSLTFKVDGGMPTRGKEST
jgi:hypothetical protein